MQETMKRTHVATWSVVFFWNANNANDAVQRPATYHVVSMKSNDLLNVVQPQIVHDLIQLNLRTV